MRRGELKAEWRGKVNPVLVSVIQFLRFMIRLAEESHREGPHTMRDAAVEALSHVCHETIPLILPAPPEYAHTKRDLIDQLAGEENKLLNALAVREPLAEILTRLKATPSELLKKGCTRPHWWMTQGVWQADVQGIRAKAAQNLFNALALLHFKVPLQEIKQRLSSSDAHFFTDFFRMDKQVLHATDVKLRSIESVLKSVTDEATRIIGKGLLLRGEPPGYQQKLRMVLFFGWDFGLCDLSNDQLYSFLFEIGAIPSSYEPETLRKYRNRLRQLIKRASVSSPS